MSFQKDPFIWTDAEAALPLRELMRRLGDELHTTHKAECPFCGAKGGKWGLFERGGRTLAKCHKPDCQSGNKALGPISYLALRRNLSTKEAAKEYLRMALPDRVFEPAPHKPTPEPTPPTKEELSANPWQALWLTLPLTSEDANQLKTKRGFSQESIDLAGIRSNKQEYKFRNEQILRDHFDEAVLVELGIFKAEGHRTWLSGQLCGWGRTGEMEPDGEGGERPKWSPSIEPPLIPYFDFEDGTVSYLRPHKGGVSKPVDELLAEVEISDPDEEPLECAAHVYIPPRFAENLAASDGSVIFTEGEFKAIAVDQCGIPCLACPGISFIRNTAFRKELISILEFWNIRDLVVIFDNEVKDDPRFPNYKPDPWKQHDTQLWAEYTLRNLRPWFLGRGGSIRIGRIPDRYREDGKADFDGVLAKLVKEKGLDDGTKFASQVFAQCIAKSTDNPASIQKKGYETDELFPSSGRRIIECKLARLFHKPRLLWGGKRAAQLARRFAEYDPATKEPVDRVLAEAFARIRGRYYTRKACPKDDVTKLNAGLIDVQRRIKEEKEKPQKERNYQTLRYLYDYNAALWERLRGIPEDISNFTLSAEYKLHTPNGVKRLVVIRPADSKPGESSPPIPLSPGDSARIGDFRTWCLASGYAVWKGSEKDLQALTEDLDVQCHRRDIHEVSSLGYHAETGIWFFGDCAFVDDRTNPTGRSRIILPDSNHLFWHDGIGYHMDASPDDVSGSSFTLGLPLLRKPQGGDHDELFEEGELGDVLAQALYQLQSGNGAAVGDQAKLQRLAESPWKLCGEMQNEETRPSIDSILSACSSETILWKNPATDQIEDTPFREIVERNVVRHLLTHMKRDFYTAIGGYDAWLALGMVFAYAAGPELVRDYNCHPAPWFSGPFGSGKSDTAAALCRIFGFAEKAIKLNKSTTDVGLARTLAQYSSLPVLVDEYRTNLDNVKSKEELLRAATERGVSPKGTIKSATSTRAVPVRTSPFVAGETSSQDSATRSRFVQVAIHPMKRKPGSDAAWNQVKHLRPHYYHIGRYILANRIRFVRELLSELKEWMSTTREQITHDRVRLTVGVGFAGYRVLLSWLGLYDGAQHEQFRKYAIEHACTALENVSQQVFRQQFFRDVISGLQRPNGNSTVISKKFFAPAWVILNNEGRIERKCKANDNGAVLIAYVAAEPLYNEWEADARRRGIEVPIPLNDLRAECSREPWWIPADNRPDRVHRISIRHSTDDGHEGPRRRYSCWAIILGDDDEHPGAPITLPDGSTRASFPHARDLIDALNFNEGKSSTEVEI